MGLRKFKMYTCVYDRDGWESTVKSNGCVRTPYLLDMALANYIKASWFPWVPASSLFFNFVIIASTMFFSGKMFGRRIFPTQYVTHTEKMSKTIKMLKWWVPHDHCYFYSVFMQNLLVYCCNTLVSFFFFFYFFFNFFYKTY